MSLPPQRPLLLDLFCCAGGAAHGYHLAGFTVIGVDHEPQPHYPFEFVEADALELLADIITGWVRPGIRLESFAAVHLSPPCQFATVYGNNKGHVRPDHPNLIPAARRLAIESGLPYVIENVYGARAHLRDPVMLCGTSFGIPVRRHRMFESNVTIPAVPCDHGRFTERRYPGSTNRPNGRTVCNIGEWRVPLAEQQEAIGINWMTMEEISQAVPPSYTEYIGSHLMRELGR